MNLTDCRVHDAKIVDYLLNDGHEDGGPKSRFFKRFGFASADWTRLRDALIEHAARHPVRRITSTIYGEKYEVVGPVRTPDGRDPVIVSVWQRRGGVGDPVLVSAYPD